MKINSVGFNNSIYNNKSENHRKSSNPNFKGLMDLPGAVMQGLENGGFIASFLVQDTLGMTVPRTREGLYRDVPQEKKKSFKNLNFKEGAEVFIREALSGPLMMFTPVLVLLLGRKFVSKSTFTNSSMIKRLGKTLGSIVKDTAHADTKALKTDFYRKNVTEIVKNTTNAADKAVETAFIEGAVEKLERLDRYSEKIAAGGKWKSRFKKAQKRLQNELVQDFNNFHKSNSSDLTMLNRIKFAEGSTFDTEKAINGMRDYIADATRNRAVTDITESFAEKFQRKSIIGRHIVNALAAASTIGSVSLVPKLYSIINPVPPGALAANGEATNTIGKKPETKNTTANQKPTQNKNNGQVAFTGKIDTLAKHFEFNGNQLTPALMTFLAGTGLIVPRIRTAVKRAPEDPVTKKKDYSEIPEVLTRDVVSTAAVTFGVPMLSKAIISSYENASGFVLQNKADKPMSTVKKVLDKLNPFSSYGPYSLKDLNQIYGNIDSPEKIGNFAKFINENNGSLAKVLNTAEGSKNVFSEFGLNIKELAKQADRKAANATIIDKMKNPEFTSKLIEAIKPAKEGKASEILKRARSLNSYTSSIATLLLVPAFLGIVLPKVVYGLTAKRHKKMAEAEQGMNQHQNIAQSIDFANLQVAQNHTFGQLKHQ